MRSMFCASVSRGQTISTGFARSATGRRGYRVARAGVSTERIRKDYITIFVDYFGFNMQNGCNFCVQLSFLSFVLSSRKF